MNLNLYRISKSSPFLMYLLLILFAGSTDLKSQTVTDSLQTLVGAPLVYLDCSRCDFDYIRTELSFVNYVRDPDLADIHVFVTDVNTVGGGREYQFSFIGRNNFTGTEYTLKHHIDHSLTSDQIRIRLTEYLKLGLVSFALQTPMATSFEINYEDILDNKTVEENVDPWDYWVFQIYVGRVELDLESSQSEFDSRWGVYADRVTKDWKLRIRPYFNYERVEIETADRDEPIVSKQHRHGLDSYAIKSINQHWSAGLFGTYLTYNGRNIRNEIIIGPGIEYSIYPYEMATRKSITFVYRLGYGYYDYYEKTIFNKTDENLFNHQIGSNVNIQQPWGSIDVGFETSQYLHDIELYSVEFSGQTSVRLFEGLSLSFQAQYNVVRNQLSLPIGEASLEEVLLRQRELATDYNFSTSIALTYTFGSKFTNIVNTRF